MEAKLVKTHGNHYDLWIGLIGLYTSTYQFTANGNLLSRKNCQAIEQELTSQTEWDVEIEMESNLHIGEVTDDSYPKGFPIQKAKLDADGCLILKLKSE